MTVAGVAVENTVYHFDRIFDYSIPESLRDAALPGCRVLVPFGGGNATRQGMILSVSGGAEKKVLKPLHAVLDEAPLLTEETLRLVAWIREHTFCTLFDAVRLCIPAGLLVRLQVEYSPAADAANRPREALSPEETAVFDTVCRKRKPVSREKLLAELGLPPESSIPEKLAAAGYLKKGSGAVRRVGDATQKMVRLTEAEELPRLTKRQKDVLDLLRDAGSASLRELCYFAGVTPPVVAALVSKGCAELFDAPVYRDPYKNAEEQEPPAPIVLTPAQEAAFQNLYGQYRTGEGGVSLLYGVTGSGKTSVFLRLIERVHAEGRGAIVMVPEISLTPQTIALFRQRFGACVAVFHSGLTLAERLDEWKRVNNGDATIVVGTRSAVFAPFRNLGLIILDEEQEGTYKSESSPRYHAREVAKFRCAYHHALLVLSSATPSVESAYYAKSGRYTLNVLPDRYGSAKLPEVTVVDMNRETENGNTSIFSEALAQALRENLQAGRQSILLLNRRGYNTFVSCRACGQVITCPNCSISLTYHAANNRLMCHYCGYSVPFTSECPSCHEKKVVYSGFGTQRAERELSDFLPQARILRLDADSTMTRFSYDRKLKEFSEGGYDLMVGTQMVAKGLDFENVTLVGVLSADQALYGEDFRSYERAFDLLTQVIGRAGRGQFEGRAVIQTFTPESEVFRLAAEQNYEAFYEGEIAFRKTMLYPPFSDICVIGFVGRREDTVRNASERFLALLRESAGAEYHDLPLRVLNPSPALIGKVSNKYRYKIIIKCRNTKRFRRMISDLLVLFSGIREFCDVTAFSDLNPETIL